MKRRRLPFVSHQRAVEVFGFLADFATAYPRLIEGDQKMYRDLARAAMSCLNDEQACQEMSVDPAIEQVIAPMVRAQVIDKQITGRELAKKKRGRNETAIGKDDC